MHAAVLYLNQAAVTCLPLATLRVEADFKFEISVLVWEKSSLHWKFKFRNVWGQYRRKQAER